MSAGDPPQELRAATRLPGGLDIDIRARRAPGPGGAEQVVISLTAPAGFEAWARAMEAANPMLAWMAWAEAVWGPWWTLMGLPPPRLPPRDGPDRG